MTNLSGKTIFITGGSRGIGKTIAIKLAQSKANIVIAAKTDTPHPKLEGTIYTTADDIEKAGGNALPIMMDIRDDNAIQHAVSKTVQKFGGIDILINNASAINLTDTQNTPMKRFDLMHQVNVRGTFSVSQACLPYLKKSSNAHILNISPPLSMNSKWFKTHLAYTMSKYGMSMCVLGMAEEFLGFSIAVNALWPKTTIQTAAVNMLGGENMMKYSRDPQIMADAAYIILLRDSLFTGNFCIDESILREEGIQDFSKYSKVPTNDLLPDLFL